MYLTCIVDKTSNQNLVLFLDKDKDPVYFLLQLLTNLLPLYKYKEKELTYNHGISSITVAKQAVFEEYLFNNISLFCQCIIG